VQKFRFTQIILKDVNNMSFLFEFCSSLKFFDIFYAGFLCVYEFLSKPVSFIIDLHFNSQSMIMFRHLNQFLRLSESRMFHRVVCPF